MKLHRYSIDFPDDIFTQLKIKAALTKQSIKDIIISTVKPNLDIHNKTDV